MEPIPLSALLPDEFDPRQYKVHFAVWNQIKHPIDVLAGDQDEWQGWNCLAPGVMEARISRKDASHGSTTEVPR